MKNKFRLGSLALILALLLAVAGSNGAAAQGTTETRAPGSWASSINLQNLEASTNNVTINFYNSSGGLAFQHSDALTANQGKSYYLPALSGLGNGQYSAMVSGTGELKAVVNSESTNPSTGYSYNGIGGTEVSTTLSFPGLYKGYYGFNSEVVLQNPNGTAASVTLAFNNGSATNVNATIPANSSRVFALNDLTQLASGNTNGKYSLVVTSTSGQELAGIANIWTAAAHGEASSYNAFTGGSTIAYAPALYKNYYNFVSALTVQNVGTAAATVTVTYSGNADPVVLNLNPGQQQELYQPNNPQLPSGNTNGVFSAKVESSGAPIVALVTVEDKTQGLIASYNGPISPATNSVNVPVALKSYFGYFSAITVQNVGSTTTDITVTFATNPPVSRTATGVPANGTFNFVQLGAADPVPANTSTSAIVTSSNNQPLVAVVQENNPTRYAQVGGGDFLFAYTGSPR